MLMLMHDLPQVGHNQGCGHNSVDNDAPNPYAYGHRRCVCLAKQDHLNCIALA